MSVFQQRPKDGCSNRIRSVVHLRSCSIAAFLRTVKLDAELHLRKGPTIRERIVRCGEDEEVATMLARLMAGPCRCYTVIVYT